MDLYENIRSGEAALPAANLPEVLVIPQPTIYPAIADRIGLLPSPQNVVAFYCRIYEITAILAPSISKNPVHINKNLAATDVHILVKASIIVLAFVRSIIEGSFDTRGFDDVVQRSVLFDIERTSTRAQQTFNIAL